MNDATRGESTKTSADLIPEQFSSTRVLDLNQIEQFSKQVQQWHTEAGTSVRFVPSHELALVDLVLDFKAGRVQDGDTPGLAALTLYTLDEGTQKLDAEQFNERLDSLGVTVRKQLSAENASVSLRSLADTEVLEPAVDLLISMVAQPALNDLAVERIRRQLLALQAASDASPPLRMRHEAFQHLFKGHAYAHALGATQVAIEAITGEAVRTFHKRAYAASNLQISLVGDLTRAQAEALADRIGQALPQSWAAIDVEPLSAPEPEIIHVEQAGDSNSVLLALPLTISPSDPEYPALMLANQVLGVGLESRLMQALRQQRGLTYHVMSTLVPLQAGGVLAIEWDIDARYTDASQQLVTDMLTQFIAEGPTQSELALACQQLAGLRLREVARNQSLVQLLTQMGRQGLPDNHLSTFVDSLTHLTTEQVRHALRHLALDALVAVSAGPSQPQIPLPPIPATDQ